MIVVNYKKILSKICIYLSKKSVRQYINNLLSLLNEGNLNLQMKNIIIKNGTLVDPVNKINQNLDIQIKDGKIFKIQSNLTDENSQIIDATGLIVSPGLIDMHVHLRDPGQTHKEDIISGSNAAARGGFTSVACMPNTSPPVDKPETVSYILDKAKSAKCKVLPVGCITVGLKGLELTDFSKLKEAGVVALSDDGQPVKTPELMQEALLLAKKVGIPLISHCEDLEVVNGGIINKGAVSEALGVKGIDSFSEDSITSREICIASNLEAGIHIAHVSTKGSTKMIKSSKEKGVKVTAETCPHYFLLDENMLLNRDANFRMNPPLRLEGDKKAIIEGIKNGAFDMIVTDHAPHTKQEKSNFEIAPNGVIGLETSLGLSITHLVHQGHITIERLIELMSANPAKVFGLDSGSLSVGKDADIVLIDLNKEWTVNEDDFLSKSKNSPFIGYKLKGKAVCTILNGNITYKD